MTQDDNSIAKTPLEENIQPPQDDDSSDDTPLEENVQLPQDDDSSDDDTPLEESNQPPQDDSDSSSDEDLSDSSAEELPAEKIRAVLVAFSRDNLEDAIKNLNLDRVNLTLIVADGYRENFFELGDDKIPVATFETIFSTVSKYKKFVWLLCDGVNSNNLLKLKKILTTGDVPEKNIVNFNVAPKLSETWLANLRHIEEHGADFFVTGNEYAQAGVNLNLIPSGGQGGVILADADQTLQQGYLTAKHIFENVAPDTIKFVLIGLMPRSIRYDSATKFLNAHKNLQYDLLFDKLTARDEYIMNLFNDDFQNVFETVTDEQVDVNFDGIRAARKKEVPAKVIAAWQDVAKFFAPDDTENSAQVLKDYVALKNYINLCIANGAQPIGVIFPFAPAVRKKFDRKILAAFRKMIRRLEVSHGFTCLDMFEFNISYDCFCDTTHLNETGQSFINSVISLNLWKMGLIPTEGFCDMNYDYFFRLARRSFKDDYNALMDSILNLSVRRIRRKDKIKIGFLMENSANWCGDRLYNYFLNDDRFEPTIFLAMREDDRNEEIEEEFRRGIEQFTARGLNIVGLDGRDAPVPTQDVMFFLKPYIGSFPINAVKFFTLTPKTLITYIPYAFNSTTNNVFNKPIPLVAWKMFLESMDNIQLFEKKSVIGAPRALYSGYPRLDVFFEQDADFHFDWKMARPDAKKIIWAPHWSIDREILYATFQWNYKFMYEFAKAHPEISWVVKPHPKLPFSAVSTGIFPSVEAYRDYLQAWDDLPNAQVYTGAYYQAIFATSDGMIHDCGSFSAEYQYVDKPMIYLTRDTQRHNELGKAILGVSYLVDGQDLDAIAATIQRVIIDGNDYRAADRREVFDKYLNYPKVNGMLASEFIYRSVVDEFKEISDNPE